MKKQKTNKKQNTDTKQKTMKKQNIVLIAGILLILAFVTGGYFYKKQQAEGISFMARENISTFIREHSPTIGNDDAKVYIVEFFDPACETCRDFYPFVKNLMTANQGKIKLIARYAPFHDGSDYFVKILEAARKQGRYWETLEVMFKYQPYWASHHNPQPELIWQFLPEAGLNIEQIRSDMNDPEIAKLIAQDLADAKTLNVTQTPEYFVNGKPLPNFGYDPLKELIESEIKANY
ncbi:MAG: thioredoxin domain-containing protein [Thermodesulfovibrionia bacterium]|nr:thioredoxin domain-containing protein [Thermodesulfovibrionia bacterium]